MFSSKDNQNSKQIWHRRSGGEKERERERISNSLSRNSRPNGKQMFFLKFISFVVLTRVVTIGTSHRNHNCMYIYIKIGSSFSSIVFLNIDKRKTRRNKREQERNAKRVSRHQNKLDRETKFGDVTHRLSGVGAGNVHDFRQQIGSRFKVTTGWTHFLNKRAAQHDK